MDERKRDDEEKYPEENAEGKKEIEPETRANDEKEEQKHKKAKRSEGSAVAPRRSIRLRSDCLPFAAQQALQRENAKKCKRIIRSKKSNKK